MDVFDWLYTLTMTGVIAFIAWRKQRNAGEWGFVCFFPLAVFGSDMFWLLLILVLLIKPRCPKCGSTVPLRDVGKKTCPACHYHGRIGLLNPPLHTMLKNLMKFSLFQ